MFICYSSDLNTVGLTAGSGSSPKVTECPLVGSTMTKPISFLQLAGWDPPSLAVPRVLLVVTTKEKARDPQTSRTLLHLFSPSRDLFSTYLPFSEGLQTYTQGSWQGLGDGWEINLWRNDLQFSVN